MIDRTDRLLQLVEGFAPEAKWLSDAETLSYLHSCVSTKRHAVRVPETPMHLDAILVDEPLTGGLEPRLGNAHLRVLTIMGFPSATDPGVLDELNARLSLSLVDAGDHPRQDGRDQSPDPHSPAMVRQAQIVFAILKEVMTNEASRCSIPTPTTRPWTPTPCCRILGSDLIGEAYVTATLTVWN